MTNSENEIDLFELLGKVILAVKRNFVFITISFFVGGMLGFGYYLNSPKVYESKMLISSDILIESTSISLIDNLDKLIKERNIQSLSKVLNLSEEQASKISSVEMKSALENPDATPEDKRLYLSVEAKTVDNTIWPQLQNGIIGYFQNNEFVKIRVEHRKKYYSQMIEKINLELVDLEKLKERITEGTLTQSTKENLVLFDPTTINSKIIDLTREKINLQNALEVFNSVQLLEGFTIYNRPAGPKLTILLVSGASLGLFLAGIFIVFKGIKSLLKFSQEKLGKT